MFRKTGLFFLWIVVLNLAIGALSAVFHDSSHYLLILMSMLEAGIGISSLVFMKLCKVRISYPCRGADRICIQSDQYVLCSECRRCGSGFYNI